MRYLVAAEIPLIYGARKAVRSAMRTDGMEHHAKFIKIAWSQRRK